MPRYVINATPVDGLPKEWTFFAHSEEEALAQLPIRHGEINSIEIINQPLEPSTPPPPPAPRQVGRLTTSPQAVTMIIVGSFFIAMGLFLAFIGIVATIDGSANTDDQRIFALFASGTIVAGLTLVLWNVRGLRERKRLMINGEPAVGGIVRSEEDTDFNGATPHRINWRYKVDTMEYSGHRTSLHPELPKIIVGDRIWVLYDPENPRRSVEWPPM